LNLPTISRSHLRRVAGNLPHDKFSPVTPIPLLATL
jgi:hypothetical protein